MVPVLLKYAPKHFTAYHEPFAGGLAFFFGLQPRVSFLSDVNSGLIALYDQVSHNLDSLVLAASRWENNADQYYKVRSMNTASMTPLEVAARFLYLNRLCVNGLFRENRSGGFNVPYDHTASAKNIVNVGDLSAASIALAGSVIKAQGFEESLETVKTGDFVFMDPPYVPFTESGFTAYNKTGFGIEKHEALAAKFCEMDSKGVHLLLTNSDTPEVRKLYSGFKIDVVQTKANTSRTSGQGSYNELIITNSDT